MGGGETRGVCFCVTCYDTILLSWQPDRVETETEETRRRKGGGAPFHLLSTSLPPPPTLPINVMSITMSLSLLRILGGFLQESSASVARFLPHPPPTPPTSPHPPAPWNKYGQNEPSCHSLEFPHHAHDASWRRNEIFT